MNKDQRDFESRFQALIALPGNGDPIYFHDIWKDIGRSPLDAKLTALTELFIAANSEQRQLIRDHHEEQHDRLWELIAYIRRVARLIVTKDDVGHLKLGLAAAAIEGGRWDYRDLIVSLVILRFAAERVGIDHVPFFNEAIKTVSMETNEAIFTNARDHSPENVEYTIRSFGPKDWISE